MKKRTRFALAAAAAALVVAFAACSPKSPDSAVQDAAADIAQVSLTPEQAALASAQRLLGALSDGDISAAYALLPASYRSDVSSVVKAYASKVDPELAGMVADAVSALGGAIEKQAAHIFEIVESGQLPFEVPEEAVEQVTADGIRQFGQFVGAAKSWFKPGELAQGDIGALLSNPQIRGVLKDAFASNEEIARTGFRLAETQPDDPARVSLESGSDEDGWEAGDMVLVEGCWIPADLADGWNEAISEALSEAADFEVPAEVADQIRSVLPALQQSFATWGNAPSADALTQQVMGTFMMLGALSMQ